jgi:hypothetical protein
MGYPLKDDLVDILRANFGPAEGEVALALPNTRIPLDLTTADEVAANLGRPKEVWVLARAKGIYIRPARAKPREELDTRKEELRWK